MRIGDDVITVRFDETVGVERGTDGVHLLVGVDGRNLPLKASDWKDGDAVLDVVRRMVPAELWYDVQPG
jgi:hypothetical protein